QIVGGRDDLGVGVGERPPQHEGGGQQRLAALLHLAPQEQPHEQPPGARPRERELEHAALMETQLPGLALLVAWHVAVDPRHRVARETIDAHDSPSSAWAAWIARA